MTGRHRFRLLSKEVTCLAFFLKREKGRRNQHFTVILGRHVGLPRSVLAVVMAMEMVRATWCEMLGTGLGYAVVNSELSAVLDCVEVGGTKSCDLFLPSDDVQLACGS